MCRIKAGNRIHTKEDMVNLITAILLRQRKEFDIPLIVDLVQYHMKGAVYQISRKGLEKVISEDIDVLKRNNVVKCKDGIYYPIDVI